MTALRPRAPGSTLPARTVPLLRETGLKRTGGPERRTGLRNTGSHAGGFPAAGSGVSPKSKSAARGKGEFSRAVKLQVRKRAGNGEIENAACEACGIWLGRYGGQVQHVVGRGIGGCKDEVINGVVNAALLCGTPFDGCHGLATAFDADIGERGFWLKRGTDPRTAPMMLASEHGSRVLVWRSEDGRYLFKAPEGAVA